MNLTENQIKRIKPLLTKLVNEVLKEVPLNNWDTSKEVPDGGPIDIKKRRFQQSFKLGMNNAQFLPSGGLAIRSSKASITLSGEESKKLANMIIRILGK